MSDVFDRDVVVLAPEERHRVERFAAPEHVARRDLPLALGDHPVLDSDALSRMRIRPPRDVAGGKDPAGARLEVLVDDHALSSVRPACSASAVDGRTPMPITTKSASIVPPPLRRPCGRRPTPPSDRGGTRRRALRADA